MNTRGTDLPKQVLYESVKTLVDTEAPHIHLPQQKLFTLFSLAFQYFLFRSTKKSGVYLIRVEDSILSDKLARKAKDPSTRKFLQSISLPRKLKYGKSTFFLDFFHVGSWSLTSDIPREKIQGALIVKNTSSKPMQELMEDDEEASKPLSEVPEDYYLTSLLKFVPKTITIAYNCQFENLTPVEFPFIKKEKEKVHGLTLSKGIDIESIED